MINNSSILIMMDDQINCFISDCKAVFSRISYIINVNYAQFQSVSATTF